MLQLAPRAAAAGPPQDADRVVEQVELRGGGDAQDKCRSPPTVLSTRSILSFLTCRLRRRLETRWCRDVSFRRALCRLVVGSAGRARGGPINYFRIEAVWGSFPMPSRNSLLYSPRPFFLAWQRGVRRRCTVALPGQSTPSGLASVWLLWPSLSPVAPPGISKQWWRCPVV